MPRFLAVGDVAPNRADPASIFRHVSSVLQSGDVVLGQMEANLTNRGSPAPQARLPMRIDPRAATALRDAGFTVMSTAGNHALDWGNEGLLDTLAHLEAAGIASAGCGADIEAARAPAIIDTDGVKMAFLAYSSVLPQGYWAEKKRPGCAPARAFTLYEQIEHDQPGTPARTRTFAHREDKAALIDDIRRARANSDLVVVSMHWGIHFIAGQIADYQRELAHAMIDAGADIIIGHHPHILKGVEFYRGKPVFYSLGNFAIDQPYTFMPDLFGSSGYEDIKALGGDWKDDAKYMAPTDTRYTFIVDVGIDDGRLRDPGLIPCYINDDSEPELVSADDPRYANIRDYLVDITRTESLPTRYEQHGDRLHPCPG